MNWRIVKQPNEKYARYSEAVDNFTHYGMTREEAITFCAGKGIERKSAERKIQRADEVPGRYTESLRLIAVVHGPEHAASMRKLLEGAQ